MVRPRSLVKSQDVPSLASNLPNLPVPLRPERQFEASPLGRLTVLDDTLRIAAASSTRNTLVLVEAEMGKEPSQSDAMRGRKGAT